MNIKRVFWESFWEKFFFPFFPDNFQKRIQNDKLRNLNQKTQKSNYKIKPYDKYTNDVTFYHHFFQKTL